METNGFFNSSVIRQKGESQNGRFKKAKHAKISEKQTFLTSLHVCVSGGKKCLLFGNFGMLRFLETPVLRFELLPYYQRIVVCLIHSNILRVFLDYLCIFFKPLLQNLCFT